MKASLTSHLFLYWVFPDLLLATLSVHKSLPYESKLFMLGVTKYSDFQTFAIAHYLDFSIFQDSSGLSPECPKPGGSTRVTETRKIVKKQTRLSNSILFQLYSWHLSLFVFVSHHDPYRGKLFRVSKASHHILV